MIVTLTTDFGTDSTYVAQLRGVIVSLEPAVRLFDITHAVPPQDVVAGALALEATRCFPAGSYHVAVVDPGVGSARPLVAAVIDGRTYVAPDNGLLAVVAGLGRVERIVELRNDRYFAPTVSRTFHGRDILAPVAVHLARGVPLEEIGPPRFHLAGLDLPTVVRSGETLRGRVIAVDPFGNLITNVRAGDLADLAGAGLPGDGPTGWRASLKVGRRKAVPARTVTTYGDAPAGTTVALVGSSDRLEIAVVGGSAATTLAAGRDAVVTVEPA